MNSDKSERTPPIVGQGEYQYECIHDWARLPPHLQWQVTNGVCIDADGFVYIVHEGTGDTPIDTVVVFDPEGRYVRSFGAEFHRGGHGIDIRTEGSEPFLYLCDIHRGQVVKTNLQGEVVWRLDYPKEAGVYGDAPKPQPLYGLYGRPFTPTNVAFAPGGGFYVADGYGSFFISEFERDARWVRTWGGEGTEPGKFQVPHGIVVDDRPGREPSLVVTDRENNRLQSFTLDGRHLGDVDGLLMPANVAVRGDVMLVPEMLGRVSLLGLDNRPIIRLGDDEAWITDVRKFHRRNDPAKWPPGKFIHPHDACFDKDGNIFIVEWVTTGRVTLLRRV